MNLEATYMITGEGCEGSEFQIFSFNLDLSKSTKKKSLKEEKFKKQRWARSVQKV